MLTYVCFWTFWQDLYWIPACALRCFSLKSHLHLLPIQGQLFQHLQLSMLLVGILLALATLAKWRIEGSFTIDWFHLLGQPPIVQKNTLQNLQKTMVFMEISQFHHRWLYQCLLILERLAMGMAIRWGWLQSLCLGSLLLCFWTVSSMLPTPAFSLWKALVRTLSQLENEMRNCFGLFHLISTSIETPIPANPQFIFIFMLCGNEQNKSFHATWNNSLESTVVGQLTF